MASCEAQRARPLGRIPLPVTWLRSATALKLRATMARVTVVEGR